MDNRTKTYLTKKQLGGVINQRGNDYELTFACFRILQFIVRADTNLHNVIFSAQCRAFVDDLFIDITITGHEKALFHQLKTSKILSWGHGPGSLQNDFYQQAKLQRKSNHAFHSYLVVSTNSGYRNMKKNMPAKLRSHSSVEKFPWYGSLNAHCAQHLQFKRLAEQLCAFPHTDKVNALVKCIYACWGATDKKNIPLSQILNSVRGMGYAYLKSTVPIILREQVADILKAIPGFQYSIIYGYFSWTFGNTDKGYIRYLVDSTEFRNIEDEIIVEKPETFDDLEKIISSI